MPRVTFMPVGQSFEVAAGTTILVSAIQNGLQLLIDDSQIRCALPPGNKYAWRKAEAHRDHSYVKKAGTILGQNGWGTSSPTVFCAKEYPEKQAPSVAPGQSGTGSG